jgi:two-component system response regulator PilR (NtrC family)
VRKNAAKLLGVTFRSLRYRLAKHALAAEGTEEEDDHEAPGRESSLPAGGGDDFGHRGPPTNVR